MRISKRIWIEKEIRWPHFIKQLLRKNQYNQVKAYVVCTSPHSALLFEIIETKYLNMYYAKSTVLAICKNKEQAIQQVERLVDALYNRQTITYTQLMQ